MATAELSRRVERVIDYPPLSDLSDLQRRDFHEALLDAAASTGWGHWKQEVTRFARSGR